MTQALDLTAHRAAGWSVAADRLKAGQSRARWIVFGLSIGGALVAALASQLPEDAAGSHRHAIVAMLSAGLLAFATFISGRFLGKAKTRAWVVARAAAEALKREAFRYAARAAPYDVVDAQRLLTEERRKIETAAGQSASPVADPGRPGSAPRAMLEPDDYLEQRVEASAQGFYRFKAQGYERTSKRLRRVEFCLAAAATLITVIAGAAGKVVVTADGASFDWAALTAVLTTVSTSILAHIEASRLDHLVDTYYATARRLEDLALDFDSAQGDPQQWSAFVNRCEDIIAAENTSWMAKWSEEKA